MIQIRDEITIAIFCIWGWVAFIEPLHAKSVDPVVTNEREEALRMYPPGETLTLRDEHGRHECARLMSYTRPTQFELDVELSTLKACELVVLKERGTVAFFDGCMSLP